MDPVGAIFYTWWLRGADEAYRAARSVSGRLPAEGADADHRRHEKSRARLPGSGALAIAAALLLAILLAGWAMDRIAA